MNELQNFINTMGIGNTLDELSDEMDAVLDRLREHEVDDGIMDRTGPENCAACEAMRDNMAGFYCEDHKHLMERKNK